MMKEFKEFAMKGNLVDIAVAFVMGAAFGKIVSALNEGIVMPIVGLLIGGFDLSKEKWVLKAGSPEVTDATGNVITTGQAEVAIQWGGFLTAVLDFLIVAFVMFMIIRMINRMKKKEEAAPAAPAEEIVLLREIRDSLKK